MRKLWMDGLKYALVSCAVLAVFWNIWNIVTGSIPSTSVLSIEVFGKTRTLELPFALSRSLDILAVPLIIFTASFIEWVGRKIHSSLTRRMSEPVTIGVFMGLIVGMLSEVYVPLAIFVGIVAFLLIVFILYRGEGTYEMFVFAINCIPAILVGALMEESVFSIGLTIYALGSIALGVWILAQMAAVLLYQDLRYPSASERTANVGGVAAAG